MDSRLGPEALGAARRAIWEPEDASRFGDDYAFLRSMILDSASGGAATRWRAQLPVDEDPREERIPIGNPPDEPRLVHPRQDAQGDTASSGGFLAQRGG